jgi:NAD(P)-dependent dehydrogenase (short-subunit alcohol dehydrogenase family)
MKNVLITGANKSIGFETARQLAKAGYHVFLGARDKVRGQQAVDQLKTEGFNHVELLIIDVADEASVQQAAQELAQRTDRLDVLINNAGIPGSFAEKPSSAADDNLKAVFEVNFFGAIRTIRLLIDLLKKSDEPRIVNVTSDLASLTHHSDPASQFYGIVTPAYGPSKTALNAYTVALAHELKDTPFKVNVVNPGYTDTDFNNHSGYKTVEDAAKPIVEYAMLGADGPTGKFVSDYGETPW